MMEISGNNSYIKEYLVMKKSWLIGGLVRRFIKKVGCENLIRRRRKGSASSSDLIGEVCYGQLSKKA